MATAVRKKYRFKSREQAEQQWAKADMLSVRSYQLLASLLKVGTIGTWKTQEFTQGQFSAKLLHGPHGPCALLIIAPTGLTIAEPDEWPQQTIDQYAFIQPTDKESMDLRNLAYQIRRAVNSAE